MIDLIKLTQVVEENLAGTDLFLVEVKSTPSNEIEVILDSDTSVSIDKCVQVSRAVEEAFDRETEDFQLSVFSAGIGQPLKLLRQYRKLIGRPVEVILKSGVKFLAELKDATQNDITLRYEEKVAVEGKKRKQTVAVEKSFTYDEIKSTSEHLDFK